MSNTGGRPLLQFIIHVQAVGIGQDTDNTYHIDAHERATDAAAGFTRPFVFTLRMISNGSADDLLVDAILVGSFLGVGFRLDNIRCVG